MLQPFALIAAIAAAITLVVAGTVLLGQVIEARIGDLRNERDFLRAQLADANDRNEALQRQLAHNQNELNFSDGALNEARRGGSNR